MRIFVEVDVVSAFSSSTTQDVRYLLPSLTLSTKPTRNAGRIFLANQINSATKLTLQFKNIYDILHLSYIPY